jgi:hypothetical protein
MIYIIGGPGKTGSSTISKRLAQDLDAPRLYGGQYMRIEAIKAGFVKEGYQPGPDQSQWDLDQAAISKFRRDCEETGRDIDKEMELYLLGGMVDAVDKDSDVVIESKVMRRFLESPVFPQFLAEINAQRFNDPRNFIEPDSIKTSARGIWLHSDLTTRAQRSIMKSQSKRLTPEGAPLPIDPSQLQAEENFLAERQICDGADYAKKYGMNDYPLPDCQPTASYGYVLDTSHHTNEDQTYGLVRGILGV